MKTSITFVNGVGEVTGSNFLLESDGVKILVDCGLVQGLSFAEKENRTPFAYDPALIDFLLVTHSHIDHIGRIPKLIKDGFRGKIYSTYATREISEEMFKDALKILQMESRKNGLPDLYQKEDVETALSLWQGVSYHEELPLKEGFSFYLKDAGHILGSAMIEIRRGDKKIVFTGDLGNSPAPLLKDTEPVTDADYLVMESVYGDRNHETKTERNRRFAEIIQDTIKRGGTVVIPVFSLERTQNILYSLNNLVEGGHITSVPVFLDSPLAISITEIYRKEIKNFRDEIQQEIKEGDDIFDFPKLTFTSTTEESDAIYNVKGPKIILAGSGMSSGGRVSKHEKEFLPDPKNTILLVGYQSLGTLGRNIENGAKGVRINGEEIAVRARIENIRGFSSHKDSDALIDFAAGTKERVKKVFVVMGEPKASLFLVQRLRDYVDLPAFYPKRGFPYEIEL